MRLILGTFAAVSLALSAPAAAQAGINVGMAVTDAAGGAVGTVAAVQGDNILVRTDKHEALLPKSSFSVADGKLLFGMTQAELNAKIEGSLAAANSAIVAGAKVKGAGGTELGTIDAVEADKVTIALASGQKIQVGKDAVRGNADGTVSVGYTAEQLQAVIDSQKTGETAGK